MPGDFGVEQLVCIDIKNFLQPGNIRTMNANFETATGDGDHVIVRSLAVRMPLPGNRAYWIPRSRSAIVGKHDQPDECENKYRHSYLGLHGIPLPLPFD